MEVRIKKLSETRLAGRSLEMSISMDRTRELWSSFMPLLGRIDHRLGTDLYNVQFYSEDFYENGVDPSRKFVKWAAAAVEEEPWFLTGWSFWSCRKVFMPFMST